MVLVENKRKIIQDEFSPIYMVNDFGYFKFVKGCIEGKTNESYRNILSNDRDINLRRLLHLDTNIFNLEFELLMFYLDSWS